MAKKQQTSSAKEPKRLIPKWQVIMLALLLIVLVTVIYVVVYVARTQSRQHQERARFIGMAKNLQNFSLEAKSVGNPKVEYSKSCSHHNYGGVFEKDTISCNSSVAVTYTDAKMEQVRAYAASLAQMLTDQGLSLSLLKMEYPVQIVSYTFKDDQIGCSFESEFYDDSIVGDERPAVAPSTGNAGVILINCAGSAQADYFPVSY